MADTDKAGAAALRNKVYTFLKDNGIELKGAQPGLSKILKEVYEHRVITSEAPPQPTESTVIATCPSCLNVTVINGKEKKFLARRKKMTQFRTKGFVASGARENLLKHLEQYPHLAMDCLDAAYVAGMDDAKKP